MSSYDEDDGPHARPYASCGEILWVLVCLFVLGWLCLPGILIVTAILIN